VLTFSAVVAGIREFLVWNYRELEILGTCFFEALGKLIASGLGLVFFVGCWVFAGQVFWSIGKSIFGIV